MSSQALRRMADLLEALLANQPAGRGTARTVPGTRRERAVNLGSVQRCADGSVPQTLFDWQADDDDAEPMTLYVACDEFVIPGADIGTADFRPMVHVEWGNGGATNAADLEVTYRQRMPFTCSSLQVQAFIASLPLAQPDGTFLQAPVPVGARAKFSAFIASGSDALPLYATRWVTQLNLALGVLTIGQARLSTLRAFATSTGEGSAAGFFQLFDQGVAPVNGDVPIDVFPIQVQPVAADQASGTLALPLGQTRAFVHGIAWGVSSTPYVFTALDDACFVTAELET